MRVVLAFLLFVPVLASADYRIPGPSIEEQQKEVDMLADEASNLRRDIQTKIDRDGLTDANTDAVRLLARINMACTTPARSRLAKCDEALSDIKVAFDTVTRELATTAHPAG